MAASANLSMGTRSCPYLVYVRINVFFCNARIIHGGFVNAAGHPFQSAIGRSSFLYLAYKVFRDHKGMMELMEEGRLNVH